MKRGKEGGADEMTDGNGREGKGTYNTQDS